MHPFPVPAHLHDREFDAWWLNTPARWRELDASGVLDCSLRSAMRLRREIETQATFNHDVRIQMPPWQCDALALAFRRDLPTGVRLTPSLKGRSTTVARSAIEGRWVGSAESAEVLCTELAAMLHGRSHPRPRSGKSVGSVRPGHQVVGAMGAALDNALTHSGTGRALVAARCHPGRFVEFVVIDLGRGIPDHMRERGRVHPSAGDGVAVVQALGSTTDVVPRNIATSGGSLAIILSLLQQGGAPANLSVESGHVRVQVLVRNGRAELDMVLFSRAARGCTVWVRM